MTEEKKVKKIQRPPKEYYDKLRKEVFKKYDAKDVRTVLQKKMSNPNAKLGPNQLKMIDEFVEFRFNYGFLGKHRGKVPEEEQVSNYVKEAFRYSPIYKKKLYEKKLEYYLNSKENIKEHARRRFNELSTKEGRSIIQCETSTIERLREREDEQAKTRGGANASVTWKRKGRGKADRN